MGGMGGGGRRERTFDETIERYGEVVNVIAVCKQKNNQFLPFLILSYHHSSLSPLLPLFFPTSSSLLPLFFLSFGTWEWISVGLDDVEPRGGGVGVLDVEGRVDLEPNITLEREEGRRGEEKRRGEGNGR